MSLSMVILLILCYSKVVFRPRSLMDKTGACGASNRGSTPLEGIILKVRPIIRPLSYDGVVLSNDGTIGRPVG